MFALGLVEHFMVESVINAETLVVSLCLLIKRAAGVDGCNTIGRAMKYQKRDADFLKSLTYNLAGPQDFGAGSNGKAAVEDQWVLSELPNYRLVAGDVPTSHAH